MQCLQRDHHGRSEHHHGHQQHDAPRGARSRRRGDFPRLTPIRKERCSGRIRFRKVRRYIIPRGATSADAKRSAPAASKPPDRTGRTPAQPPIRRPDEVRQPPTPLARLGGRDARGPREGSAPHSRTGSNKKRGGLRRGPAAPASEESAPCLCRSDVFDAEASTSVRG